MMHEQPAEILVSLQLKLKRLPRVGAVASLVLLAATSCAFAQSRGSVPYRPKIIDEVRFGVLDHNAESAGSEGGLDLNVEVLFGRPAIAYGSGWPSVLVPRIHLGTSINTSGDTSQVYSGFTWTLPLQERLSLEVTFGGSVHDGPLDEPGRSSFGCSVNFRESASIGYSLSDKWRLYGTVAHMSNADLCDRNSGLTSAGVRLGYVLD
jgi:hypothetical protein